MGYEEEGGRGGGGRGEDRGEREEGGGGGRKGGGRGGMRGRRGTVARDFVEFENVLHHGYQRACDLITGQASTGPDGSPVFACAGKTEPPSRLILSQTSAGKSY